MVRTGSCLWALCAVVVSLCVACFAGEMNKLTKQEIADGWILLFDGETTFGWEPHGEAKWKVADGALVCDEGGRGWLGTTTEFADFILKAEFRVSEGGNSGIFFRCDKGDQPWITGYEMQIGDHEKAFTTGSIEGVAPAKPGVLKPNTWQSAVITAEGDHLTVTLDGTKLVDTTNAKFARGFIGLQHYKPDMKIEARNILLKPQGLKPIFNGKDLTGWKVVPGHKSVYSVTADGAMNVKDGNGDIQTEGEWADFCFQLDVFSNGKSLNSGVFFRGLKDRFWAGYEVQIRNQWEGDNRAKPVDYGTGGIYNRQAARGVVSSDKEWFKITLVAAGNHIATWVDGYQVTDWTDTRPANDNPRNGCRLKAGVISLQGHDPTTDLSFRNLNVGEYPKPRE